MLPCIAYVITPPLAGGFVIVLSVEGAPGVPQQLLQNCSSYENVKNKVDSRDSGFCF